MTEMRGKNKASRAVVVAANLVAIAAILGLAELAVRWFAAAPEGDDQLAMCQPDARTIWRYRPNLALTYRAPEFEMAVRTNDEGLRSSSGPAEDRPTILFVGDSFTFGWGVAEQRRFSEVIGRTLGDVRIVNAGHWMYAFDQQLVLLKELVGKYRPAAVVQGFYWLHVRTLFNHALQRGPDGAILAVQAPSLRVDSRGVLGFHSDWIDDPPLGSQLLALGARFVLNRDLRRQAARWVEYMQPGSATDADLWATTDDIVGQTIAFLRGAGIAYVPFLIPSSVELGSNAWAHLGWWEKDPPAGVDIGLPAKRLAAMFDKRGTAVIDLAGALKARGGPALYITRSTATGGRRATGLPARSWRRRWPRRWDGSVQSANMSGPKAKS
jgi:hypothetical protein